MPVWLKARWQWEHDGVWEDFRQAQMSKLESTLIASNRADQPTVTKDACTGLGAKGRKISVVVEDKARQVFKTATGEAVRRISRHQGRVFKACSGSDGFLDVPSWQNQPLCPETRIYFFSQEVPVKGGDIVEFVMVDNKRTDHKAKTPVVALLVPASPTTRVPRVAVPSAVGLASASPEEPVWSSRKPKFVPPTGVVALPKRTSSVRPATTGPYAPPQLRKRPSATTDASLVEGSARPITPSSRCAADDDSRSMSAMSIGSCSTAVFKPHGSRESTPYSYWWGQIPYVGWVHKSGGRIWIRKRHMTGDKSQVELRLPLRPVDVSRVERATTVQFEIHGDDDGLVALEVRPVSDRNLAYARECGIEIGQLQTKNNARPAPEETGELELWVTTTGEEGGRWARCPVPVFPFQRDQFVFLREGRIVDTDVDATDSVAALQTRVNLQALWNEDDCRVLRDAVITSDESSGVEFKEPRSQFDPATGHTHLEDMIFHCEMTLAAFANDTSTSAAASPKILAFGVDDKTHKIQGQGWLGNIERDAFERLLTDKITKKWLPRPQAKMFREKCVRVKFYRVLTRRPFETVVYTPMLDTFLVLVAMVQDRQEAETLYNSFGEHWLRVGGENQKRN